MTLRDTIQDQIERRGPAAVDALKNLAAEYGDDILLWAWTKIKLRRKRRAKNAISDAADVARERVKAGG
jgi:hypothetical protein